MGIVKTALGLLGGSKLELLKMLIADRTDGDERIVLRAGAPWSATRMEILGTPEATAYTIAESLNQLSDVCASDEDAMKRVEGFRAMSGLGSVRIPSNVLEYGRMRVRIEHKGIDITDEQIHAALLAAEFMHRNPNAPSDTAYYCGKFKAQRLKIEGVASSLVSYLDGALSDDGLWSNLDRIVGEQREKMRIRESHVARFRINRLNE